MMLFLMHLSKIPEIHYTDFLYNIIANLGSGKDAGKKICFAACREHNFRIVKNVLSQRARSAKFQAEATANEFLLALLKNSWYNYFRLFDRRES